VGRPSTAGRWFGVTECDVDGCTDKAVAELIDEAAEQATAGAFGPARCVDCLLLDVDGP